MVKALIGIAVLVLAAVLIACGDAQQPATRSIDEPLLSVLVTPWGLYVDDQVEPVTLAELETMFAALADQPGEVRLDSSAPLGGFAPTSWERSKVDHLSRQVAALVSKHGLHIVTEAGRMPVRGWASPPGSVDP